MAMISEKARKNRYLGKAILTLPYKFYAVLGNLDDSTLPCQGQGSRAADSGRRGHPARDHAPRVEAQGEPRRVMSKRTSPSGAGDPAEGPRPRGAETG